MMNIIAECREYVGLKIDSVFEAEISWKDNIKTSKSNIKDASKKMLHFSIDEKPFRAFDMDYVVKYKWTGEGQYKADSENQNFIAVKADNFCKDFEELVSILSSNKSKKWSIRFTISGYSSELIITDWEIIK